MKKTIYSTLFITLLLLSSIVQADMDVDLDLVTDGDIDADFEFNSGGNTNINLNINGDDNPNITENFIQNNYITENNKITKKSTDRNGIMEVIGERIFVYLGIKKDNSIDTQEYSFMSSLDYFVDYIMSKMHSKYVYNLELELQVQKNINALNQQKINELNNILNLNQSEISMECQAYINIMQKTEGINSITCNNNGIIQEWKKTGNTAVTFD